MSKKICRENDDLAQKIKGKQKKYYCSKCEMKSPKEKWCCKPKEIRR